MKHGMYDTCILGDLEKEFYYNLGSIIMCIVFDILIGNFEGSDHVEQCVRFQACLGLRSVAIDSLILVAVTLSFCISALQTYHAYCVF